MILKTSQNLINMKKYYRLIVPVIVMLILTVNSEKLMSQPDPPPLPDQHGINGDPSPQGAPLDDGSTILLFLGMVYGITKVTGRKRGPIIDR
jgi:hypothetical protein